MKINQKTTQAAVLEALGEKLTIKTLALPDLKKGQVLVKVLYSGVCRSQLMEVQGFRGEDKWLPHLLGHEGSGVVIDIGEGVKKIKCGDHVILSWIKSEGLEAPGAIYNDGETKVNSGQVTTFSSYTIVSENRLVLKPKDLPFDIAVLFGCALPTGAGMVLNEINVEPENSIAVIGLGGIGISALMTLISRGLKNIIVIDISNEKLAVAKTWGAKYCFNPRDCNVFEEVSLLFGQGIDFCIEASGQVEMIECGFNMVRKNGGKLLFASHPPEGEVIKLHPHDLISGKQIAGSWGGAVQPDRDVPIMHALFRDSKAPLHSLLIKRYALAQINEALDDLNSGRVFRPLIEMPHDKIEQV